MNSDPFSVGALWPHDILPKEKTGNFYVYLDGNHLLVLSESNLSPYRIHAVQHNVVELALVVRENILFLCHHFEGFASWGDIPYNWHLLTDEQTQILPPVVAPNEFLPLLVVLVEAENDCIVARRGLRLPPTFGNALHKALRVQAAAPFSMKEFDQKITRIYQEFPTPEDLVTLAQEACIVESTTGQHNQKN